MDSSELNQEAFLQLQSSISDNLPHIQDLFDTYQQEYFLQRPPEFFSLELCGEAGELANKEKKLWKGKQISDDELSEEAADVFIALFNYVNSRKLNFTEAIVKKLQKIQPKS